MTDRDPRAPRHGRPGGPDQPPRTPPAQPPQQPYGGPPYGQAPYPPGPPQGEHPYGAPPPLYRREDGVAGPGFALPDAYKTPVAERPDPERKQLFRLRGPLRVIVSVVALVVGTGVAVGLPYREQLQEYQKHKKAVLTYKVVPKNGTGVIAGVKFALGSVSRGDPGLDYKAPAGTTAVKALIGYRAPDHKTEVRANSGLEYGFRDGRGRTWIATSAPGPSKGKVKSNEIKALVPTAVAGQVLPVVRPVQQLDPLDDPTQIPRGPALEFQR